LSDYGRYECNGTLGNITSKISFTVIIKGFCNECFSWSAYANNLISFCFIWTDGIELTRDDHNTDDGLVLERSNVTLICRAHLISPPKWAYYLKDSDTHPIYIDETMSPPVLGKEIVKERTNTEKNSRNNHSSWPFNNRWYEHNDGKLPS
jgi:hypothetical protein